MLSLAKSLFAAQQEAAARVAAGRRFSVRLPLVGTVQLPPPDQLAFYGALAGLAALELIDWPVAVAMGVGSVVVSRQLSDLRARESDLQTRQSDLEARESDLEDQARAAARKTAARKAPARKTPPRKAAPDRTRG